MITVIVGEHSSPFCILASKYDLVRSYCLSCSFFVFDIRGILIIISPSLPSSLCVCTCMCTLFLGSWWGLNSEP